MLKASEIYLLNEALDGKDIYGLDKEAISKRDYYKSKRDYEESNPEIVYVKWWWED